MTVDRAHQVETPLSRRARYLLVIAGTILGAQLGLGSLCHAGFSADHFKRVWAEEFGHVGVPASGGFPTKHEYSLRPAEAGTPTPHPAVARIVVPEGEATSFGSGTLVDVRDDFGIVITNWHVVRDAQGPIEVIFPGGFTSKARTLKLDADWDLAALVVWRPPVEPVKIATAAPQPGDQLTICGYGPGIYRAATGRCTQYYAPKENLPQQMVELNVEARQGDSGGPILNSRGELAGVLFGAGNGTTLGSYGGRVDQFLASLAPNIGGQAAAEFVKTEPVKEPTVTAGNESKESIADTWHSNSGHAVDTEVKTVSNTLLEPPAFDELEQLPTDQPTPLNTLATTAPTNVNVPVGQSLLFEKLKTGLAAFGLFSIAVMLLKAAG
jgi:hypothetical protein